MPRERMSLLLGAYSWRAEVCAFLNCPVSERKSLFRCSYWQVLLVRVWCLTTVLLSFSERPVGIWSCPIPSQTFDQECILQSLVLTLNSGFALLGPAPSRASPPVISGSLDLLLTASVFHDCALWHPLHLVLPSWAAQGLDSCPFVHYWLS